MNEKVFLEGLPGIGKTTIINIIKSMKLTNIYTVDEIINPDIINNVILNEETFLKNEEMKLNKFLKGKVIFDRGPISVLAYSQVKHIINTNYNSIKTIEWFEKNMKSFTIDAKIVFLTNVGKEYSITVDDCLSPYGSIENQKLLEAVSLYNCKKYFEKVVIKEYYKENMEEIINEIIN